MSNSNDPQKSTDYMSCYVPYQGEKIKFEKEEKKKAISVFTSKQFEIVRFGQNINVNCGTVIRDEIESN